MKPVAALLVGLCGAILMSFPQALWAESVWFTGRRGDLRLKPVALSKPVKGVTFEAKLELLEENSDGWLRVRFGGVEGYVHKESTSSKPPIHESSDTSRSVGYKEKDDMELAGKGFRFDEKAELAYRAKNPRPNYGEVDAMERIVVSYASLEAFWRNGKLGKIGG